MKNGTYIYYSVQQRHRAEGGWLKLDSKIKEVPESDRDDWSTCGGDFWGRSMNPYIGKGHGWRPRNPKANEQFRACNRATGEYGWWDIKYAISALKRARKDDEGGMYDSFDGYGRRHCRVRHEFRLVKVHLVHQRDVAPLVVKGAEMAAA